MASFFFLNSKNKRIKFYGVVLYVILHMKLLHNILLYFYPIPNITREVSWKILKLKQDWVGKRGRKEWEKQRKWNRKVVQ